jgi:tetratricopeptide (TPR) repeat protein
MKYQTKINIAMSVWLIALIVGIAAPKGWGSGWDTAFCIAYPVLCLLLLFAASTGITSAHVRRVNPILMERCDPEKYLGEVYNSMPSGGKKRPDYLWTMMAYEGQYAAGRYGEALAELQQLTRFSKGRTGAAQKAAWFINLAEVSTALGRPEDAEKALADCLHILDHAEIAWKLERILRKGYRQELCKLGIAQGRFEGAEEVFGDKLAQAKNQYERVGAQYYLGLAYQHSGEAEKAREAFEYAVEHGNRLHLAALARERLGLPPQPAIARLWQREEG